MQSSDYKERQQEAAAGLRGGRGAAGNPVKAEELSAAAGELKYACNKDIKSLGQRRVTVS